LPRQNGLKQADAIAPVLFVFALEYAIRGVWGQAVVKALRYKPEGREFASSIPDGVFGIFH